MNVHTVEVITKKTRYGMTIADNVTKRTAGCAELLYTESADCGCPEEHYLFNGVNLDIHYDADGEADAVIDFGDWQDEISYRGLVSRHAARLEVFQWAFHLTTQPEM